MEEALKTFHNHKKYLIQTQLHPTLNIPKFHSLLHYIKSIKDFSTIDNYNTETFERFHIDFAKKGFRASNKRDIFPQMVAWLTRKEKMCSFDVYTRFASDYEENDQDEDNGEIGGVGDLVEAFQMVPTLLPSPEGSSNVPKTPSNTIEVVKTSTSPAIFLAKYPAFSKKPLMLIERDHKSPCFSTDLKDFLNAYLNHPTSR